MLTTTPGYVRNIIRRCFREQIDKSPTKSQVDKAWEYFHNSCAYCGKLLNRSNEEGHVDHLVSASQGGANNISNRVLSCAKCNAKEKFDKDYPCIKCHTSKADTPYASRGTKIYHLPFDRQYDKTKLEKKYGEFYCKTVKEAEDAGFRRAFRYRMNKEK